MAEFNTNDRLVTRIDSDGNTLQEVLTSKNIPFNDGIAVSGGTLKINDIEVLTTTSSGEVVFSIPVFLELATPTSGSSAVNKDYVDARMVDPLTIVRTSGSQTISGEKLFLNKVGIGGSQVVGNNLLQINGAGNTPTTIAGVSSILELDSEDPNKSDLQYRLSSDTPGAPALILSRSRGTLSSPTPLQSNDWVGSILGMGYNGTSWNQTGRIDFYSEDGSAGRMEISTTPSGSSNPISRFKIFKNGSSFFTGPLNVGKYEPTQMVYISGTSLNENENYLNIDASSNIDKGLSYREDGELTWQNYIWNNENSEFYYLWNEKSQLDVLTIAEVGRLGLNKQSNYLNKYSVFSGTGLNDLLVSGINTHSKQKWYHIEIATTGTPDTLKYKTSSDGITYTSFSTASGITGSYQVIDDSVSVKFNATTGHTISNNWKFLAYPQVPQATTSIAPRPMNEVLYASNYLSPTYKDITYIANSNSFGSFIALSGTNSACYIGSYSKFNSLSIELDETSLSTSGTVVLEYWNGSSWTQLTSTHSFTDGTAGFTKSGQFSYDKKLFLDWTPTLSLNGSDDLYWMRLRSSTVLPTPLWLTTLTYSFRRFALYGSHFDDSPNFMVDAVGRTTIGKNLSGNESNSILHVEGSSGVKIERITANKTLGTYDNVIICDSPTPLTVTLPDSTKCKGRSYGIKKFNTGNVTIIPFGTQTIDGYSSVAITNIGKGYDIISDGTNWYVYLEGYKSNPNKVIVESIYDLPTPSSGIITLVSGVSYKFNGKVNIGTNTLKAPGYRSLITGDDAASDGIIYTGSGAMLTVSGADCTINNISIDCPTTGSKVFDINGYIYTTSGAITTGITVDNVSFGATSGCYSLGNIQAVQSVNFKRNDILTVTSGITLSGVTYIDIEDNNFGSTTSGMNHITITSGTQYLGIVLQNNKHGLYNGQTALVIPEITPSGGCMIDNNLFSTMPGQTNVNALSGGLTFGNVYWTIKSNFGLRDNKIQGYQNFNASTTATTISSTGIYYKAAGTNSSSFGERFDVTTNNRILNKNLITRDYKILVTGAIASATANQVLRVALYKWTAASSSGAIIMETEVRAVAAGVSNAFALSFILDLATNDYLEVHVRNTSAKSNLTMEFMQFRVTD